MRCSCRYQLYGSNRREQALVDESIDAVEDLQCKYLPLVYMDKLSDEGKANYWKTHGDPATKTVSLVAWLAGILHLGTALRIGFCQGSWLICLHGLHAGQLICLHAGD